MVACGAFAAPRAAHATLLLRYSFDEASSGTTAALDTGAPPAANGTFTGSATRTSDTPGGFLVGALNLNTTPTPKYVNDGDADKLDGLSQFTLTAWINLQGNPANGNRVMAKQNNNASFDGFSFAISNQVDATPPTAGSFQLNLATGGTQNGLFAFNTSGANMSADHTWMFVAVTYDGLQTSGNVIFYDGGVSTAVAQLGTAGTSNVGALQANANEFRVGASSTGTASAPILIDDVRVYDQVLNATQLDQIRQANVPEPASALLCLVPLLGLAPRRHRRS